MTVLTQAQLIAAALLGSCVIFGGVVMFVLNSSADGVGGGDLEIMITLAAVLGATSIPLAFFVRRQVWSRRSAVEGDARDNLFRIGAIVFVAILEGAILLNLVAWLLTGEANPPAIMAGILLFIGVLNFPREGQLEVI